MLLPVAIFEGIAFSYNELNNLPLQMLTPLCQVSNYVHYTCPGTLLL